MALHSDRGQLHSRSGSDLNHWFPGVADAAAEFGGVVLDGELVADTGQPPRLDFAAVLQTGTSRRRAQGVSV